MSTERLGRRTRLLLLAPAAGLLLAGGSAGAADVFLPAKPPSKAATESSTLEFVVTGDRWTFSGRAVPLKEVARTIEAKVPVEIRIQDASLESVLIGMKFDAPDTRHGMRQLLVGFNYLDYDDPKSGRRIYLVSSLASEVRPVAESRPSSSVTSSPVTGAAPKAEVHAARSLDEFRKVTPARIASREQPQAEIERDFQRERDEKLLRAIDTLSKTDLPASVHGEALADLARSGDPRATSALGAAMTQVAGLPDGAAPLVARAVWQHAAQLQYADAGANALLLSLASSPNAAVRGVAQVATQDMNRYRAAQNTPPGR